MTKIQDEEFLNLEPHDVLRNFFKISQIFSRRPDNTQGISDYLADFGRRLGLDVYQDESTNVIIKKPATAGYEQAPTVMLAAHMDMICAVNPGVIHDFDNSPLNLLLDDDMDTVRADGTTLGADCGLGMAFILSVLESHTIMHPAIEAVFTTNEETDMKGAQNLHYERLQSKIILSLDAARLALGGAGELEIELFLDRKKQPPVNGNVQVRISISGLLGGHSGKDAYVERGNAITLLSRVLSDIQQRKKVPLYIGEFQGGYETACAFARTATCVISFPAERKREIEEAVKEWDERYHNELEVPDPKVRLTMETMTSTEEVCDKDSTDRLLTLLTILPDGICSLHKYFDHRCETSVNLGVVETEDQGFKIITCIRSAIAAKKYYQFDKIRRICNLMGVRYQILHDLPEWKYIGDSRLVKTIEGIYADLLPDVAQGTCEQGIFLANMQGAEAVGIGPRVNSPHSPNEYFSLLEAAEDWDRFLQVLKVLKNY